MSSSTVVAFDISQLACIEEPCDKLLLEKDKIYWIHCDLSQANELASFAKSLNLPEHVLTLCTQENISQRVVDTGLDLTLQIPCLLSDVPNDQYEVKDGNLLIYLTEQYCFTASRERLPALAKFQAIYPKNVKYAATPGFIVFLLLDIIINDYSSILQEYERIADNTDILVHEVHKGAYSEVMAMKKQVVKIKRYLAALRDTLMRISGRKISVISEPFRQSLCGLFDHAEMLVNQADAIRETLNGTLDLIENILMQKLNSTMRILTGISAIFLPLSVLIRLHEGDFAWFLNANGTFIYSILFFILVLFIGSITIIYKRARSARIFRG